MKSIRIRGASEHNLKGVSLDLPRDSLVVFTGVSGSGKSSLAFDTIYKEGRRRFLESLSSYARRFLGGFEKPRVESIGGLSPAVSIEQKTIQRSPRSTVGTITEIHDHLRLLYARLGQPHCSSCGKPVRSQSAVQVVDQLLARHEGSRALFCAPVVRDRRGEYRLEIEGLRRDGYRRLRIDGEIVRVGDEEIRLERHRSHTIEVIYDRVEVVTERRARLIEAVEKCFALAEETVDVVLEDAAGRPTGEHLFSGRFACADCGVDLPELAPRLFSFNSTHGMCLACSGLGVRSQVDPRRVVRDTSRPFRRGGLAIFRDDGTPWHREVDSRVVGDIADRFGFSLDSSWGDLGADARVALLDGDGDLPGLIAHVEELTGVAQGVFDDLHAELPCADCDGARLSPLARAVTFQGRSLSDMARQPIDELLAWFEEVELDRTDRTVGDPIIGELRTRLGFLVDVGLSYLTLSRSANTLAGGEAQRIRLASQVGAGLQGVVFVLDEPSIGLHSRDNHLLLRTLESLRDVGNSVLVVEHDRATMETADWIVDLGPGAGIAGGEVVAEGDSVRLMADENSVTGAFLSGRSALELPARRRPVDGHKLTVFEAAHNNLQGLDVEIPLSVLVAVTGVSGSGKSSLINQVLRPALLRKLGRRDVDPGTHRSLLGYQHIDKLVVIDQSPIGKSPRSNPATYTKVFGPIRELFARLPDSRARGYSAGRFSFNVDGGRCIECRGAGVRVVDMQFLAPVEVTCEVCGGHRYNRQTLEILFRGKSIYEILELSISEALELFQEVPRVVRSLEVLEKVGLGYLGLGQASTTLSGGEAQRLKLASELQKRDTGRTMYILDEPTTGLHFEDVRVLLEALDELVDRGNSVIVIEHNLDVVNMADWVIDLGPEGGDRGGRLVTAGTPEQVAEVDASHTGRALREASKCTVAQSVTPADTAPADRGRRGPTIDEIRVEGATVHNLQGVDVSIPRDRMTVITGVSGSGKSSLAFDTLFAEGQRRYVDSLSTYARQFLGRLRSPPVERITGLCPAIAIDQKSAGGGHRSTVATITEIHDYLRLLFAHIGVPHCPACAEPLAWVSPTRLAEWAARERDGRRLWVLAPLELESTDAEDVRGEIARLLKSGCTRVMVDGSEIRLDEEGDAPLRRFLGALRDGDDGREQPSRRARLLSVVDRLVVGERMQSRLAGSLEQAFDRGAGVVALCTDEEGTRFFTRTPSCPHGHFSFDGELTPRMFSFNSFEGACEQCRGTGVEKRVDPELLVVHPSHPVPGAFDAGLLAFLEQARPSVLNILRALLASRGVGVGTCFTDLDPADREVVLYGAGDARVAVELASGQHEARWEGVIPLLEGWERDQDPALRRHGMQRLFHSRTCDGCEGHRLRPEFLSVRVGGLRIHEILQRTIASAREHFKVLELDDRRRVIAGDALREIDNRLRFLVDVGVGYLTLDRSAGTLSGGEAQRIRLASQLGNRLVGVLYVLDEPTIGLHPRDTRRLLASLEELRDQGNTIVLVEHDEETIRAADWLIDMGPGAGAKGGRVVACGTPTAVGETPEWVTGRYLRGDDRVRDAARRRSASEAWVRLHGVRCHNIEDVDVCFPLGLFTAVTGVSGSGKSSLVMDVLAPALEDPGGAIVAGLLRAVEGTESFSRLVVIDQKPVGRTPRSVPATYAGVWDPVRELYASLTLSRTRGYKAGRFSFNSPEGRCLSCEGQGAQQVEMHFLSDVWVLCDTCGGRRFDEATLEVRFKGKNIADVLEMDVDEGVSFFENQPRIQRVLETLQSVGLGYVRLGQPATTLSGGEAQRVKLAAELVDRRRGSTVYVLDEPTTGLHFEDVKRLIDVLQRLVDQGHTVIVIEHQLDVIAAADRVLDLGPEAAAGGGRIVAEGTPEEVAASAGSYTGECLRKWMERTR